MKPFASIQRFVFASKQIAAGATLHTIEDFL